VDLKFFQKLEKFISYTIQLTGFASICYSKIILLRFYQALWPDFGAVTRHRFYISRSEAENKERLRRKPKRSQARAPKIATQS
jgi:hypothetical protein